jgi:Flp pilus assembly pilin Flp
MRLGRLPPVCLRKENTVIHSWTREEGQTMAEYAVILGVIALAIVLAIGTLSTAISGAITTVAGLM